MIKAENGVQSTKDEISGRKHVDPPRTSQLVSPQEIMHCLFAILLMVAEHSKHCLGSNASSECQMVLGIPE